MGQCGIIFKSSENWYRFRSGKHDTDLLPSGHPMSSKDNKSYHNEVFDNRVDAQES